MRLWRRRHATGVSYASLDAGPARRELRRLALAGLGAVTGHEPGPLPDDGPLAPWLDEVPPPSLDRFWAALLFSDHRGLSAPAAVVAASALPPRFRDLFRRREPSGPAPGAAALVPALMGEALSDPSLRMEGARRLRRHLAARVVFHPEPEPLPVLATQTWALLAAAAAGPDGLPAPHATALRDAARALAEAPGWAGPWDAWVLAEAGREGRLDLPAAAPVPPRPHTEEAEGEAPPPDLRLRPDWPEDDLTIAARLREGRP